MKSCRNAVETGDSSDIEEILRVGFSVQLDVVYKGKEGVRFYKIEFVLILKFSIYLI